MNQNRMNIEGWKIEHRLLGGNTGENEYVTALDIHLSENFEDIELITEDNWFDQINSLKKKIRVIPLDRLKIAFGMIKNHNINDLVKYIYAF